MTSRASTHQKALQINLDASRYGTFAEIGAGQEVARWFFHVGGAAGTVAKTISAYDMVVSSSLYGRSERYVSRVRLESMLTQEFELLMKQLSGHRSSETAYFVFGDTMATRSFSRQEDGHGWMGVRFQHKPGASPSEIILHVRMLDHENVREQEAIGTLGVNLVYGAFYIWERPEELIASLIDDLTRDRIEIDLIRFAGPCFTNLDNRLMILQLVVQSLTGAVMFTSAGEVMQPADALHMKPVIVERGSFRPATNLTIDMLERARGYFHRDETNGDSEPVVILEMTTKNLLQGDQLDPGDYLARVDVLGALGHNVMITSYGPHYQLAKCLRRYTNAAIVFALGVPGLRELFDPKYYVDLPGGILDGFGQLFCGDVRLHVYPSRDPFSAGLLTMHGVGMDDSVRDLYHYLVANGRMVAIEGVDESRLHIFPQDVMKAIQSGDSSWQSMVPSAAVKIIKDRGLFGYREPPQK
jgi:hypothetical protein